MRSLIALLLALFLLPVAAAAGENTTAPAALDIAQYHGRVVYLDFWASWCVPCRKSFPWLNELARKYPADLVVVGINVDHERGAAARFLEKYPANFPLVYDPDGKVADAYQLEGMPSAVILDRKGKVVHRHIGFREEQVADYEAVVRGLATAK